MHAWSVAEVREASDADGLVAVAGWVRRAVARAIDSGLCAGAVGLVLLAGADSTNWTVVAVLIACVALYEVASLVLWGATPGKLLLGLRVFRFPGGGRISLGNAAGRFGIFTLVGALPCSIGAVILLVSAANDPSGWRRAWHDRAAGTVVVKMC